MRIIDRIDRIREKAGLNKSQFERRISKSTGYLNMLDKKDGQPGSDVILKILEEFPDYNLNWLMLGEGPMIKTGSSKKATEESVSHDEAEVYPNLREMHADLKKDLEELSKGMTRNFEVVSAGIMRGLKDQQKILDFLKQLDANEISRASKSLSEFLEEKKE